MSPQTGLCFLFRLSSHSVRLCKHVEPSNHLVVSSSIRRPCSNAADVENGWQLDSANFHRKRTRFRETVRSAKHAGVSCRFALCRLYERARFDLDIGVITHQMLYLRDADVRKLCILRSEVGRNRTTPPGAIHFPETPWREPIVEHFKANGLAKYRRPPGYAGEAVEV